MYTDVADPKTFSIGTPATEQGVRLVEALVFGLTDHSPKLYKSFPRALVVVDPDKLLRSLIWKRTKRRTQQRLHEQNGHR